MLKTTVTHLFNEKLAGEMFNYDEIVPYLDLVIDEINADLSSTFPTFSEYAPNNYDLFPDKYIRSVVIPGAAYKWFSVDEEGASTAPLFQQEYEKARFEMVRDYIDMVPYEYQNDLSGGVSDPFYYDKLTNNSEMFGIF